MQIDPRVLSGFFVDKGQSVFVKSEEGYRRGAVLGLTVAEIFILLVFLMLLALMGVNRYWNVKLDPWREIMAMNSPKVVEEALKDPELRKQEIEELNDQIEELEKEKQRLQERVRILEDREGETGERLDQAEQTLKEREEELADAKKAVDALGDEVRILGKGITPPCWYQLVEETNPITKAILREKPYYLFDIAIREDHMEVQRLPTPVGSANDDGGNLYSEEAKLLPLESIPYGVPLTDYDIRELMYPIYIMGKASEIRSYSCIFYVRVWDETSTGAKVRWKQAHDTVLEQLFGTHQVRGRSWEERENEPVNLLR